MAGFRFEVCYMSLFETIFCEHSGECRLSFGFAEVVSLYSCIIY